MDSAPPTEVPVGVRVQFAHASVQTVAERCGADLLHIKGPAVDPDHNPGRPIGSDADVLVRPAHVRRFVAALRDADWVMWCDFDEGSAFEHAASFHHDHYGMLDVHQNFPGLHRHPAATFDRLWARRGTREIAGVACAVPDLVSERLILLLHAARTSPHHVDLTNHWSLVDEEGRGELDRFAKELGAFVGVALATGRADEVAGDRELAMWESHQGSDERLGEWAARWRDAEGVWPRVRLVRRAVRVNRFVLGERLGHPPTEAEIRREWFSRLGRGARAAGRAVIARMPGRSGS